jgi:putative Mg2+ transporter-C (MgtC) family protein
MPLTLTWPEISIRLLCTLAAAGLIGLNRSEHGHAAGLRTSILVCLAACLAMVQVNLLLPLAGRSANSFVMNDLMRLPLGILSGMGFIGAGAIVRRDNLVVGVTTAATLWFLTVIGLCFGSGLTGLGIVGAALGALVLTGLKVLEDRMKQDRQATLLIVTAFSGPGEDEIRSVLQAGGFRISSCALTAASAAGDRELTYVLQWRTHGHEVKVPEAVQILMVREGVVRIAWTPQAR